MRTVACLAVLASCVACSKQAPSVATPQPRPVAPRIDTGPPVALSPTEALSKLHHAEVSVDESIELPDGVVVGYTFDLAEALIGESTANGDDVQAEIEEAEAECEAEIAAMSEEDRQYREVDEDRSCSALAIADVLGDEALSLGCGQTAIAVFDLEGNLVTDTLISDECSDGFGAFDVRELGPHAKPTLWVSVTHHGDIGRYERGGWGFRTSATDLYMFELAMADDARLTASAEFMLERYRENGNCGGGTKGGVRFDEAGVLLHFQRDFNECDGEGCVPPDEVEAYREGLEDDDDQNFEVCEVREVTPTRYVWNPEGGTWDEAAWVGEAPPELPDDRDY